MESEFDEVSDPEEETQESANPTQKGKKYEYPIKKQTAEKIYDRTGEITVIDSDEIPVILKDSEKVLIDECLSDLKIDLKLNNMQLKALVAVINGEDLILISPCGTGKMLVYFLATALLRKIKKKPDGISWILQPLNSICEDKRNNNSVLPMVFVKKSGEYKFSEDVQI